MLTVLADFYHICHFSKIHHDRFEDGKRRAAARRSKSQNSLAVAPPLPDETEFIHALYLNSRMLKAQKNDFLTKMRLQSGGEMGMGGIGQKELDLASLLFAPPTGQGGNYDCASLCTLLQSTTSVRVVVGIDDE